MENESSDQRPSPAQPNRSLGFRTAAQTSSHLRQLLHRCRASDAVGALIPWFCESLPSARSRREYFRDLERFLTLMNEQGVSPIAVTGDHVRLYREFLTRAGRRPATIARALTVIRGTYERFGKKHLLPWEQVRDIQAVTAPRVDKNTTPELSETDAIRLLEAPDRSTLLGMRDFGLLFAYFRTACRSRALAHAAVGDLEESSDGLAIVVLEKGAKQRRLLLLDAGPAVQSWLRTAGIADDSDSPLFPALAPDRKTLTRRHLTQQAILNVVKKYAAQIGLTVSPTGRRGLCTHSLRKTAAVNAADHGAPVEQIRAWLGHSDLRTTQTYLTERETDAEHAARRCQIRPK